MKIGIIGLGLIGGSLARAFKKKTEHVIFGRDISDEVMLKAQLMNAIDDELTEANAAQIDLLIISLYPQSTVETIEKWLPLLKEGATVIDCVGNKRKVVDFMKKCVSNYPHINFVGMHPMAGREYSGIDHATAGLYEKATVLAVPVNASLESLAMLKHLFISIGCEGMVITNAEYHDKMISYTSQLAHLISNAYVRNPLAEKHYGYSAGSFRDMTRVARINPAMWTELMMDNRDNLEQNLDNLIDNLTQLSVALKNNDKEELERLLSLGNEKKMDIESGKAKKLMDKLSKE